MMKVSYIELKGRMLCIQRLFLKGAQSRKNLKRKYFSEVVSLFYTKRFVTVALFLSVVPTSQHLSTDVY